MTLPTYGQPIVRSDPQTIQAVPLTFPDSIKLFFGDDDDASIVYDGADLVINPKEVGAGTLKLEGDLDIGGDIFVRDEFGVVIGAAAPIAASNASKFQVLGTSGIDSSAIFGRFSANNGGPTIRLVKSRNAVIGSHTIVQDNDRIGVFRYCPDDGVDFDTIAADFFCEVDDPSPAANDIGMAFVWEQMPGGGGALRETMRLAADGTLNVLVGPIDLNSQGGLQNIGAAGNDWVSTGITMDTPLSGSNMQVRINNTSPDAGSNALIDMRVGGTSAGDPLIIMRVTGGQIVSIGLDNSVSDNFTISDNGGLGTNDRLRLAIATGVLSLDGSGAGDALPTLFDDYDDAHELRTFQLANVPLSVITNEQQLENQRRLVEIGVAEWAVQDDGTHHWMMRLQPLTRLLAGGVYQNRQFMENCYAKLDARLKAIGG